MKWSFAETSFPRLFWMNIGHLVPKHSSIIAILAYVHVCKLESKSPVDHHDRIFAGDGYGAVQLSGRILVVPVDKFYNLWYKLISTSIPWLENLTSHAHYNNDRGYLVGLFSESHEGKVCCHVTNKLRPSTSKNWCRRGWESNVLMRHQYEKHQGECSCRVLLNKLTLDHLKPVGVD